MNQISEQDPTIDAVLAVDSLQDSEDELEGLSKDITNKYSQALTLESISNVAEGMSGNEKSFDFTLDILNKLAARTNVRSLASESFYGGTQQKKNALKLAIEDLGDTVREIIKSTLRMLKRIYEVAFDFIEGVARGANATLANAEKLQDAAAQAVSTHGARATRGNLGNMSITRVLVAGSGNYSFSDILAKYRGLSTGMNGVFDGRSITRSSEYLRTTLAKVVNKNKSGSFTKEEALSTSNDAIEHLLSTNFSIFETVAPTDRVLKLPFGGVEFRFTLGVENDKYAHMTFSQRRSSASPESDLPSLSPEEVLQLGKLIESTMHSGIYRNYKQIKSALISLRNDIDGLCAQISKDHRTKLPGNIPSLHFIKTITASQIDMLVKTYSYIGTVTRALLAYGWRSLKNLGPAKTA